MKERQEVRGDGNGGGRRMGKPGRVQKEQGNQLGQKVQCSGQGPGRLERCGGDVVLNPIGKGWSLKVSQQKASRMEDSGWS